MAQGNQWQSAKTVAKAIQRFEAAVRGHAFKGCADPIIHNAIEVEYKEAKNYLAVVIGKYAGNKEPIEIGDHYE